MKNSKIAVAALMALIMFSYSKAEEIKVDFDGLNLQEIHPESGEGRLKLEKGSEVPAAEAEKDNNASVAAKDKLDDSLVSAIKYAEGNNSPAVSQNLKKLLTCGKKREKADFLNAAGENYAFPERILFMQDDLQTGCELNQNKARTPLMCVQGHYEENCVEKEVCATEPVCGRVCNTVSSVVCNGAGLVIGAENPAVGMGVGVGCDIVTNEVCDWICKMEETCKTVKECKNIFVCDEYSSSNSHNGDQIDGNGNVIAHR